jgi:hypothetical protein
MSVLHRFIKVADRFGSVLLLLTTALIGGATILIGV